MSDKNALKNDNLTLYDKTYHSRFMLGTALYPSPDIMAQSITASQTQIITASLRRENAAGSDGYVFGQMIKKLGCDILPNTAGCYTVKEAVNTAYMARELFGTKMIKLEVIGHAGTLQPSPFATIEAAKILSNDGFHVFPYITDDIVVCEQLISAGCKVLMPWASPIGTGRGINNPYALMQLRRYFPNIPLIIDAGLGTPSHAAQGMEMGYDAVLLNTAVAKAGDCVLMAQAFYHAIVAGRMAYLAKIMPPQDNAQPSTPEFGTAFSPFA